MSDRVRVLIFYRAPEGQAELVEKAYHEASGALEGTAGLLGNELLREHDAPDVFVVLSEWESMDAFLTWERGTAHRSNTSPMRQYQDRTIGRKHYGVFQVVGHHT